MIWQYVALAGTHKLTITHILGGYRVLLGEDKGRLLIGTESYHTITGEEMTSGKCQFASAELHSLPCSCATTQL